MKNVTIYLKGWRDGRLYTTAANHPDHELHAEAWKLRDQMFLAYKPGHVLHRAFEYTSDDPDALDSDLYNQAFEWFNVGTNEVASRYRAAGNRSLSVGDVVVIDGRAYGVAAAGWDRIENFEPTLAAC